MKHEIPYAQRLGKLPAWARQMMFTLQRQLDEAREKIKQLKDAPESNTIVGHGYHNLEETIQYLSNNQLISFKLKEGTIRVNVSKDNTLYINADGHKFGNDLCILPKASNVIELAFKPEQIKK